MFETFDFLNGYLKITALVGALDVLLILHFLLSYYFCCYKKGYLIDLWHGSLLFVYFFTILVFYPFMGSERLLDLRFFYNWSYSIQFIDWAWFINVLGFIAVFFGGFCFTYSKGRIHLMVLYFGQLRNVTMPSIEYYSMRISSC